MRQRHSAGRRKRSRVELAVGTSSGSRPRRRYHPYNAGEGEGGDLMEYEERRAVKVVECTMAGGGRWAVTVQYTRRTEEWVCCRGRRRG